MHRSAPVRRPAARSPWFASLYWLRRSPGRNSVTPIKRPAVLPFCGLVRGHCQPPRLAVDVVGEPGGEDDVSLVRKVDSPTGLQPCRCSPPQPFVIDHAGQWGAPIKIVERKHVTPA